MTYSKWPSSRFSFAIRTRQSQWQKKKRKKTWANFNKPDVAATSGHVFLVSRHPHHESVVQYYFSHCRSMQKRKHRAVLFFRNVHRQKNDKPWSSYIMKL